MTATRRRTLRALGASLAGAALAGCSSRGDPDGDGADDDRETDVTVRDAAVLPEVVAPDSPDSVRTYGGRDEQFVGVELEVGSPDDHPPESFAVSAAGEEYETFATIGDWGGPGFGDPYDPANRGEATGWLAARLPKPLGADAARLVWDGGEYGLPETVLEDLNRPPADWTVGFEAPESVAVGEELTLRLTVENVADVEGTFVAGLNRVGPRIAYAPETEVHLEVDAGETARWEYDYRVDPAVAEMDDPFVRFLLRWRDGSPAREVDVETD